MSIDRPGTLDDLLADATAAGHPASVRLIRDWTERGLLDSPERRPAGKGHGSHQALYSSNQRRLFLALLDKRGTPPRINSLARIPVYLWLYWGEEYVPLRQARRAFMTWLGDAKTSKERARVDGRTILGLLDHPHAAAAARRALTKLVTEITYTGHLDHQRLERAARQVFEPDGVPRRIGHPAAPLTVESVVRVMQARFTAIARLRAAEVTDEEFLRARQAHLIHFAEYTTRQPEYAAQTPQPLARLFDPVTEEKKLNNCCSDLLTVLGLQILATEQQATMTTT